MKTFLKPTWKKIFLTLFFFIVIAVLAMHFGTQAFVWSDEQNAANAPIHFKLNPFLWFPAWYVLRGEVVDFTILKSLYLTAPYWLIMSYVVSSFVLTFFAKKNNAPRLKSGEGLGGEV